MGAGGDADVDLEAVGDGAQELEADGEADQRAHGAVGDRGAGAVGPTERGSGIRLPTNAGWAKGLGDPPRPLPIEPVQTHRSSQMGSSKSKIRETENKRTQAPPSL